MIILPTLPRISFGVIVLNGEPFTRYCLRALYPYAHQIIVVEGAVPAASNIATPDGHSTDDTLNTLQSFVAKEDKEGKITIVTAEDEGHINGFWPGEKDQQSQAYAQRATGDYLWQVDVDEFYHTKDIQTICHLLKQDPTITAVSLKMITFWGGYDYICDGWYLRRGANIYHRIFKWGLGYQYTTHRPPTVINADGQDLRKLHWVKGHTLARQGIWLHHYSLLFPKQVFEKCNYYSQSKWARREYSLRWASQCYMQLGDPFRVHNVYSEPSWLERFRRMHPIEITRLKHDIENGHTSIDCRNTEDIEQLLKSPSYAWRRSLVKAWFPFNEIRRITSQLLWKTAAHVKGIIERALGR